MPRVTGRRARLQAGEAKLWVISLGINQYRDPNIEDLKYSAIDCQELGKALEIATQQFLQKEIAIYHDFNSRPPVLKEVVASLEKLKFAGENDTVIFYFSGHGFLEKDTQKPILCLRDTQLEDNSIVNPETGLKVEDLLTNYLAECPAKQQIVFLDACHSGALSFKQLAIAQKGEFKTKKISDNTLPQLINLLRQKAAKSKGFYAILSCDKAEKSLEFSDLGHGLFTYYLIRGLQGEAADSEGVIEVDRLYNYIYHQTIEHVDKTNQQIRVFNQQQRSRGIAETEKPEITRQTPRRIVEGTGEFIIGISPTKQDRLLSRVGLVINGLSLDTSIINFCGILRNKGKCDLRHLVANNIKIKTTISDYLAAPTTQTIFLYLRGTIAETEEGTNLLLLGNEISLSRDWLIEQLRASPIPEKILILDCPEATNLNKWIETLQLGTQKQQCIIGAATAIESSVSFSEILEEIFSNFNSGLTVAQLITELQRKLLSSDLKISLYPWLSGATGVIDVLLSTQLNSEFFDAGICPYKGLEPFTKKDAFFFYGREQLREEVILKLENTSFLAVVGASASGKSSFVRAVILPVLEERMNQQCLTLDFCPGSKPIKSLAAALARAQNDNKNQTINYLEGILYLGLDSFLLWLRSLDLETIIFSIDRFEDLFTLSSNSERNLFLNLILGAIQKIGDRLKVIITLRSDFISSCFCFLDLESLIKNNTILIPSCLSEEEYRRIISLPASSVGLTVEPALIDVLVEQVKNYKGALALLQYILKLLWENRTEAKLTLQSYQEQIGGLKGVLERKANELYARLNETEKKYAEWIFLSLVHLGEGREDTCRSILKSELFVPKYSKYLLESTLNKLIAAKLIVVGTQNCHKKEDCLSSEISIEIAHEILIRNWSQLRWWLHENRNRLQAMREIEQNASRWKNYQYNNSYLLRGDALVRAEKIYLEYFAELSLGAIEYLRASLKFREQLVKATEQQQKSAIVRNNAIVFAAIVSSCLILNLARQSFINEIKALNKSTEYLLALNKDFEALVQSLKVSKKINSISSYLLLSEKKDLKNKNNLLLQKAIYRVREINRFQGHQDDVIKVSFSPDGKTIATASEDKTVKLWTSSRKKIATLKGHSSAVYDLSFSPDGKIIATASWDGTVKLWTLQGQAIDTTLNHSEAVYDVSFSPDGKIIATASWDGTVKLWTLQGQAIDTTLNHSGPVYDISFSPDGKIIATASNNTQTDNRGNVTFWDLKGQKLKTIAEHEDWIWNVKFSPDGQKIATASRDGTVKLWRLDGNLIKVLDNDRQPAISVSFSPDGTTIATTYVDKKIILWNSQGEKLQTLTGHKDWVWDVSFFPDGNIIASASKDKTVKLWQIKDKKLQIIPAHNDSIYSISFSPNGKIIATASADKTVKIWSDRGDLIAQLQGHQKRVDDLTFSPDGKIIATASADKTVKIWRNNGQEIPSSIVHDGKITSISFSPNGKKIATASADKTVKIWTLKGELLNTLQHQDTVSSVNFSPDGKIIATAGWDRAVYFWTERGQLISTLKNGYENGGVYRIVFSPDGKNIATASADKTVKIWYLPWQPKSQKLKIIIKGNSAFNDVVFSPDGQKIATASEDKTVKLWTLQGKQLQTFLGHDRAVSSLSFSPEVNKNILASSDLNGKLIFWDLNLTSQDFSSFACDWLKNYLENNPNAQKDRYICNF